MQHVTTSQTRSGVFSNSKRCSQCLERRPLDEFRRLRSGSKDRVTQCRACHNLAERARVAAKRSDARTQRLLIELQKIEETKSQRCLLALVADLTTRFGGTEGLAEAIHATFKAAEQSGNLRTAVKMLLAIGRLCQRSASLRELNPDIGKPVTSVVEPDGKTRPSGPPNLSQMTDAQLEARQRSHKRKV
jgi:hypothetical protein